MTRFALIALCFTMVLAACSKATDTVIPSDMAAWDKELAPVVQKLNDEDKALLVGYIARKKLASVFSKGANDIPFGTTVGDALKEQRSWKEQFEKAEAAAKIEQAQKAAEELALKKKLEDERAGLTKQFNQAVTVTLLNKKEFGSDYRAGRYGDYQQFSIGVENRSDKELSGVAGTIEFIDVFDKVVGAVGFGISEKIKPGATYKWTGGRDYNQFIPEHKAVWNIEEGKYTTRFVPESLVFADGTKLTLPE